MKHLRWTALLAALAMLLTGAGCTPETVTPSSVSSSAVSDGTSSYVKPEDITVDIPADGLWTWNDLYDYLENPLKSGDLAFDEEQGEFIVLYDSDWVTILTDWDLRLTQDMMVIKYNRVGAILERLYVNLTGQTEDASGTESAGSSAPSDSASRVPNAVSGPGESSFAASSRPTEPSVNKTVITVQADKNNTSLKQAAEAFNRQSKTVQVQLEEGEEPMTAVRLEQLCREQKAPDLVLMNRSEMALASARHLLTELSALGADRMEPLYDSVCWNKTVVSGGRYGLPVGCVTACVACNDELLYRSQTGVPDSFDQLLTYAGTIRETLPGVTPIGLVTDRTDSEGMTAQFTMMLWSFEGDLLTADCQTPLFYSLAGLETLVCYRKLQQEELVSGNVSAEDFLAGETAYGIVASTQYSQTFGRQAKANYTAAPLVMPGAQSAASLLEVYSYCLSAAAGERSKAAYEFLSFYLTEGSYALNRCRQQDWIPALTALREDEYYQTDAWQVFMDAIPGSKTYPAVDCMETVSGYLAEAVSSVLDGTDPEDALQKAKEKTENRLNRK